MTEPRAANCRQYVQDAAGLVRGVRLQVETHPTAKYALQWVELVDEEQAAGRTSATSSVMRADGSLDRAAQVYLAWPWPAITEKALPGNRENRHHIANGFDPLKTIGPLALYVGDAYGAVLSDIVGGLGLPGNHHVSYLVTFQERPPDPQPPAASLDEQILALVKAIAAKLHV